MVKICTRKILNKSECMYPLWSSFFSVFYFMHRTIEYRIQRGRRNKFQKSVNQMRKKKETEKRKN